ncbi:SDR family oxidoreductase [Flavitalea sp. BT771]|uniref:NAD-dependent epimerase/dehydratase family protein n=1 Tax=Flavitalea sp. BT771 TaxID=3063329 RepID=UPI0026E12D31|nr:SDR family oxidoreductase [Flavitalea sp. BT771]MDO6434156.1 SDR family oxidoreductase [Flavitalea sp. BT771]MDV6223056.1 SDR family oxidoreductase [Flavitalea sp. BT771]
MKVALLGINGYIGKSLGYYLLQQGCEVHGYDLADQCGIQGIVYESLDVRSKEQFAKLDTTVDLVFYFSGITGTAKAYEDYEAYVDVNEKGILHLLSRLDATKSNARVIFPSTRLVYKGVKDKLLAEDDEKEFKTIYALNKWFGETLLHQYGAYFGRAFTIFRICVPYGNLLDNSYSYGTVGFFMNKAVVGKNITLYGTGGQKRSFTHVGDLCRQIFLAINKPESVNQVFNIAGETFSLYEVADAIAKKYAVGVELIPWPVMDEKLESGDTIFSAEKISGIIGSPLQNNFNVWLQTIK